MERRLPATMRLLVQGFATACIFVLTTTMPRVVRDDEGRWLSSVSSLRSKGRRLHYQTLRNRHPSQLASKAGGTLHRRREPGEDSKRWP